MDAGQSKWEITIEATKLLSGAWFERLKQLREAELAEVTEDRKWEFSKQEQQHGNVITERRQRHIKCI